MSDFEIYDLSDLMSNMIENVKEDLKSFDDIIDLQVALDRQIYISDIREGLGTSIDGVIRFWNQQDDANDIPIEDRKPIKIYIDSNGGSLDDTLTIVDSIKMSNTPVIGICTGKAYSGGFFIFISCDKRIAYPHSSFLFHEGSTSTGGTASQFDNYAQFYKKQLNQLMNIVLDNSNITAGEYKDIKKDDVWYDAEEGIKKGFVDKIAKELI